MIRCNFSRHDRFAGPRRAFDDHAFAPVANWINGKHDSAFVRLHHLLHQDGHARISDDALLRSVEERTRREQRRPAFADTIENGVAATHVQITFLLTGETGRDPVFGYGARTHRDQVAMLERGVGGQNGLERVTRAVVWTRFSAGLRLPRAREPVRLRRRGSS